MGMSEFHYKFWYAHIKVELKEPIWKVDPFANFPLQYFELFQN